MLAAPLPRLTGVRRIAVLRADGLGDLVLALPALEALRAAYPDAEIVLLGREPHRQLLEGRPGPVDRVAVVPPGAGMRPVSGPEVDAFFAAQSRVDLAVQLHGGGAHSNPFVHRLGARLTVGARAEGAPPLDRDLPYVAEQHEVLRMLELVGLAGAAPVGLLPRLTRTPEDDAAADAVLPPDGRPLAVLHPGARDPDRRWPAERFAAVASSLRDWQVAVVGSGPDDAAAQADLLAAGGATVVPLVDRLPMSATVGLLARASVVVANDSGPRHVAEALGTPTVGVFWLPNVVTAGPLSRARHRVVVGRRTTWPTGTSAVADVPVEQVLAAVRQLAA